MNRNLQEAIFNLGKVQTLMESIERLYLDLEVVPEDEDKADRGVFAFYALWDEIKNLETSRTRLSEDKVVLDAIYAVNAKPPVSGSLKTKN